MTNLKLSLPFWEGFLVSNLERRPGATWITLEPDAGVPPVCPMCSDTCPIHETTWRTIRDMPMLGDPVWLQVPLRRVRCDNCGARVERVSWLDRHARMTRRLADFVALCEVYCQ
ncbi:transposase family protein [Duganella qianjiadongensis]|uniref:transposase family protein n=1 Tax=Duganella qianjiadongensis TaxID=2692176 RepID=UPI002570CDFD|nr:transposase family protein [Duganella qianjiadongensis]